MGTSVISELKEELLKQVEQLKFVNEEKVENYNITSKNVERGKQSFLPLHYVDVYYAKYLFVRHYCDEFSGEPNFSCNFKIFVDEMNRMINENIDKKYLHFFFCNIDLPLSGKYDLGLIMRFSDNEDFSNDYDLKSDNAYFINNGQADLLEPSENFGMIVTNFRNKIGGKISNNSFCKLTEYITYDMDNIKLFDGFEHELIFEVIGKEVEDTISGQMKLRLGLVVYIKDKDRIHHLRPMNGKQFFEGYYDAGDLKP